MHGHRLDDCRAQRLTPRRFQEIRNAEDEADELPTPLREKHQLGSEMVTDRIVGCEEGLKPDGTVRGSCAANATSDSS